MAGEKRIVAETGFCGRVLNIDLTRGTARFQEPDPELYRLFLGGYGLAARLLWERLPTKVDPLGPDNILAFSSGVLTETGSLFTGRFSVLGVSPVTGGFSDANCGGRFSPALKRCGLDAVLITGRAEKPVYLLLTETEAQILDAAELWGLDTYATEDKIKELHGKRCQSAVIGPAGEKLSLISGVANDYGRLAARSGLGAVMGSKNLKAVAALGRGRIRAADPESLSQATKKFKALMDKGKFMQRIMGQRLFSFLGWFTRTGSIYMRQPGDLWRQILDKYGTSGITSMSAESGDSPIKNWSGSGHGDFPLSRSKNLGGPALAKYQTGRYGCSSCPLRCGAHVEAPDSPWPTGKSHRPEYETLCALGGLILNDNLEAIIKINDLANRAGLDTISLGGTMAMAIECFENGLLTIADTNGLELKWGDADAAVALAELICRGEGLGATLLQGSAAAAREIGPEAEKYAVTCGGVEAPMHDPKFDIGAAMTYHAEPAPGRHTVAMMQTLELAQIDKIFHQAGKIPGLVTEKAKLSPKGKGAPVAAATVMRMLMDCAGACEFGGQIGGPIPLFQWLDAATGQKRSPDEYYAIGERIQQLRQALNLRLGINSIQAFRPHPRIYGAEPLKTGPAKGLTLDQDGLVTEYCQAFGWNPQTGAIDPNRLKNLGLDDVAESLG